MSMMSVDECTYRKLRTHTVRGVRTPPTLGVHSRTLPTVYLHFRTLTHGNQRLGMVCDAWRRCVYAHRTSRRNAYTTRRPETVCAHKVRQPTHLHVFMRHYKSHAHMISPIGFVHAGPCACPHVSHWLAQYSISI